MDILLKGFLYSDAPVSILSSVFLTAFAPSITGGGSGAPFWSVKWLICMKSQGFQITIQYIESAGFRSFLIDFCFWDYPRRDRASHSPYHIRRSSRNFFTISATPYHSFRMCAWRVTPFVSCCTSISARLPLLSFIGGHHPEPQWTAV